MTFYDWTEPDVAMDLHLRGMEILDDLGVLVEWNEYEDVRCMVEQVICGRG